MSFLFAQAAGMSPAAAIVVGALAWAVSMICAWWFPPPPPHWPAWPAYTALAAFAVAASAAFIAASPAARWLTLAAAISANASLWVARRTGDDDGDGGCDLPSEPSDDPSPDSIDWERFDSARRDWGRATDRTPALR